MPLYVLICCASQLVLISSTVWSNFEIADMDFFRGDAYSQYFDFLDRSGGYYYEVGLSDRLRRCRS